MDYLLPDTWLNLELSLRHPTMRAEDDRQGCLAARSMRLWTTVLRHITTVYVLLVFQ